jgi:hypothetical protein
MALVAGISSQLGQSWDPQLTAENSVDGFTSGANYMHSFSPFLDIDAGSKR